MVEIVSYTIWPLKDSRIPNPMAANIVFSAMNYPSIMLYILAYIISLQLILESATPKSLEIRQSQINQTRATTGKSRINYSEGSQDGSHTLSLHEGLRGGVPDDYEHSKSLAVIS